jgi:hypothetical protein
LEFLIEMYISFVGAGSPTIHNDDKPSTKTRPRPPITHINLKLALNSQTYILIDGWLGWAGFRDCLFQAIMVGGTRPYLNYVDGFKLQLKRTF